MQYLRQYHRRNLKNNKMACLTLREKQVAQYITQGLSNKYIAAELGLSARTVESHRARIFQKMQVRNAVELVQYVWSSQSDSYLNTKPTKKHSVRIEAPGKTYEFVLKT